MTHRRSAPATWLALLTLLGCNDYGETPEPVRVGVVTSITGELVSFGAGQVNTAELAQQEVNAAGGVLPGRELDLLIADDHSDPEMGRAAATRLIDEDGAVAIVGAFASGISVAISEVTLERGVTQVSCCSTSDRLTDIQAEGDRYFFRTVPPDGLQAIVLAGAAHGDFGCTNLAVMHLDNAYGTPFGEAIETNFRELGGTVATRVAFADGLASYVSEVLEVQATVPDCVALVGYPESAGRIVRDWNGVRDAPAVRWIGADAMKIDAFIDEVANPAQTEGFTGTSPITAPMTRSYATFETNYRATFGTTPEVFSGPEFDAVSLTILAIARAGTTDGLAIRDSLYEVANPPGTVFGPGELGAAMAVLRAGGEINYEGAAGPVDLDGFGNVVSQYEIWQWTEAEGFTTLRVVEPHEIR
ncbi:MAG: ABC transporter substrate-binding protein [Deltaproteobacteria bacterium]|nr:ABC transporter substrate-binding protein [Deltaproteobacteria bacterium]